MDELLKSGLDKMERGPSITGVMDTKTGKIYYGINNLNGYPPEVMHTLIEDRINNMPKEIVDSYIQTRGAGSHAEVYDLNEALLARDGANYFPEVLKYGNKNIR